MLQLGSIRFRADHNLSAAKVAKLANLLGALRRIVIGVTTLSFLSQAFANLTLKCAQSRKVHRRFASAPTMECDMKLSKNLSPLAVLIPLVLVLGVQSAQAHCQVPCGIFDDNARVKAMMEDAVTVDKATTEMAELQGKTDPQSVNQTVRWVMNKESHAQKIISTISDYFLTQRVKPSQEDYVERLKKHHAVMLAAMKAKQHADKKHAEALMAEITALARYYPEQ